MRNRLNLIFTKKTYGHDNSNFRFLIEQKKENKNNISLIFIYVYSKNMPKSIIKYTSERQELLQKLLNILEITDDNKMFSLKKLDEDEAKQKQILDLVDDIKKYFICGRWTFFSQKNMGIKRNYLSLIKSVFREMNVKIYSTFVHKKINDVVKCETIYILDFLKVT